MKVIIALQEPYHDNSQVLLVTQDMEAAKAACLADYKLTLPSAKKQDAATQEWWEDKGTVPYRSWMTKDYGYQIQEWDVEDRELLRDEAVPEAEGKVQPHQP